MYLNKKPSALSLSLNLKKLSWIYSLYNQNRISNLTFSIFFLFPSMSFLLLIDVMLKILWIKVLISLLHTLMLQILREINLLQLFEKILLISSTSLSPVYNSSILAPAANLWPPPFSASAIFFTSTPVCVLSSIFVKTLLLKAR